VKAIELNNIRKTFGARLALDVETLAIDGGRMVAVIGPSGAGKSTLMRHISGLVTSDRGTRGSIRVHDELIQSNGRLSRSIRRLRAEIGVVFQQFNLVGRLTLLQNVLIGTLSRTPFYRRWSRSFTHAEKCEAMRALDFVGMSEFAAQRASTLSGGQQQRGAVARAIVQRARVVLADEPIASLDPESARVVMQRLRDMNQSDGVTVLVSVHQIDYASRYCDDVVAMRDGRILDVCPADRLDLDKLKAIYGERFEAMQAEYLAPAPVRADEAASADELKHLDIEARLND